MTKSNIQKQRIIHARDSNIKALLISVTGITIIVPLHATSAYSILSLSLFVSIVLSKFFLVYGLCLLSILLV